MEDPKVNKINLGNSLMQAPVNGAITVVSRYILSKSWENTSLIPLEFLESENPYSNIRLTSLPTNFFRMQNLV